MFSPSPSSSSSIPTAFSRPDSTSFTLPPPTGECRFILLHPSVSDQRCSCQGFRRNESRHGANCECGHQACYHAPGSIANAHPLEEKVSPAQTSLLERICRLEEQHRHDRRVWEKELKEERRARREDARVLREAMHSFYKFMEQEVPRKFAAVDDKTDGLLDHVSRLEDRIGMIDDSTMALESRVMDLEGDGDGGEDEDGGGGVIKEGVTGEKPNEGRDPKREMSMEENASSLDRRKSSPRPNNVFQPGDLCNTLAPIAASEQHHVPSRYRSPSPPTSPISKSPRTSDSTPAPDLLEASGPSTGAHTYVHRLTSPLHDSPFPPSSAPGNEPNKSLLHTNIHSEGLPLIKQPVSRYSPVLPRDINQGGLVNQQQISKAYPSPDEINAGPYCELPSSLARKRKLDVEGQHGPEMHKAHGLVRQQRPMFIPMPPPLSLSGSDLKA